MPSQTSERRQASLQAASVRTLATGLPLGESTSSEPCPSHQQFLCGQSRHGVTARGQAGLGTSGGEAGDGTAGIDGGSGRGVAGLGAL